jgi:hypothetical protein
MGRNASISPPRAAQVASEAGVAISVAHRRARAASRPYRSVIQPGAESQHTRIVSIREFLVDWIRSEHTGEGLLPPR